MLHFPFKRRFRGVEGIFLVQHYLGARAEHVRMIDQSREWNFLADGFLLHFLLGLGALNARGEDEEEFLRDGGFHALDGTSGCSEGVFELYNGVFFFFLLFSGGEIPRNTFC